MTQNTDELPDVTWFDYLWFYGFLYGTMMALGVVAALAQPGVTLFSKEVAFGAFYMFSITTITIVGIPRLAS